MGQRNYSNVCWVGSVLEYLRALIEDRGSLQEEKLKEGHIWTLEIQNKSPGKERQEVVTDREVR